MSPSTSVMDLTNISPYIRTHWNVCLPLQSGEEAAGETEPEQGSRVLRTCAEQLCGNLGLNQEEVPELCKTSCLDLVCTEYHASALSDYRPVALTSQVMKVLQSLFLTRINKWIPPRTPCSLLIIWCLRRHHIPAKQAAPWRSCSLISAVLWSLVTLNQCSTTR